MSDDVFNATIVERRDVSPDLAVIKVRPDSGFVPAFEPGQFCTLGMSKEELLAVGAPDAPLRRGPRMDRRSYSIVSSPGIRDHYELFVVLVPTGKFTPRLWTMAVGSRLWMQDRAEGMFTLADIPADKDLLMIATGTGIGPYVSILRTYRNVSPRRWRRIIILHGTRLAGDLAYHAELKAAAAADETVQYIPIVTREPEGSGWTGLRGRVQAVLDPVTYERLTGLSLDPSASHVFLCGNPGMITDVQGMLESRGFVADQMRGPKGNIHFERYW